MSEDDLLREASDPTTPGERLEELYRTDGHLRFTDPRRLRLVAAVRRNPNLPIHCLRDACTHGVFEHLFELWHNPSLPLLMLAEPGHPWEHSARELLRWMQHGRQRVSARQGHDRLTLAARIAPWASGRSLDEQGREQGWDLSPGDLSRAQRDDTRALCRHLAVLFGLPWPEP